MTNERKWEEVYGLDRDPIRKHIVFPLIREIVDDARDISIVDLGCGNGAVLAALLDKPFGKAIGVDISEEYLSIARNHIDDSRVQFLRADLTEQLPLSDNDFDLALSIFVFNELPELTIPLCETARVLKSGGCLILTMTHPFVPLESYLFEKFTKQNNKKFTRVHGYFERYKTEYMLTLSQMRLPYYPYTFQTIFTSLLRSGFIVRNVYEKTVNNEIIQAYPEYAQQDDVPRFLIVEAKKDV